MYQRILLALDGSLSSNLALHEAAQLMHDGAKLHVITVVEDPFLVFASPYGVDYTFLALRESIKQEGQAILLRAQQQLAELGISAQTELIDIADTMDISVPEAILHYAGTCQAELIILGTHGRRGLKRLLLGSVAEQVLRSARIPVMLVRDRDDQHLTSMRSAANL